MMFGGFGCEPGWKNCGYDQESYVSHIDSWGAYSYQNENVGPMVSWEMTNNGGYNTIDSIMHRETGYLVHSQTFMCKGSGSKNV